MGAAHAEASIALGLGANVLVGGANGSVALQPASAGGEVGFDVGAGIGEPTPQPASAGGEVGFDVGAGIGEPTLQPAHRMALACRGRRRAIANRRRVVSRLLTSPGDA